MATSIGCRHVGGERIADGIGEFRCRYWCMYFIVRDPIRINRVGECNGHNYNSCIFRDRFKNVSREELRRKKTDMRNAEKRERASIKRKDKH